MILTADNDRIKKIGRTHYEDGVLWCGFSGSGIKFLTDAPKLSIEFVGDSSASGEKTEGPARVAVYIDGKRNADFLMEQDRKLMHFERDRLCLDCEGTPMLNEDGTLMVNDGLYEVQVIKLSESAMSMIGIGSVTIEGESENGICLPDDGDMKLEFVGDSITCGYGVDVCDPLIGFTTGTEDVTKGYAYQAAQLLGADYSMVCLSGYGIISGYTDDDKKREDQLIPTYYEKTGFSYAKIRDGKTSGNGGTKIQDIDWDFSAYVPDAVVINLGTNDNSYCKNYEDRLTEFRDEYKHFLKTVRSKNENACILCVLGLMPVNNTADVKKAVDEYIAETGDTKVYFMEIESQKPEEGLAADYHPAFTSHLRAAKTVAERLRSILCNQ